MKYIFANTWNGDGYTESTAELIELNPGKAKDFLNKKLQEAIGDNPYYAVERSSVYEHDVFYYLDSDHEDCGRLMLIEINQKPLGVDIWPCLNEVTPYYEYDKKEWEELKQIYFAHEDVEEFGDCAHNLIGGDGETILIEF